MPTLPVPVFAALVLGFACLRLWQEQGRLTAPGGLLAVCAAQSLIIALAQHYQVPGLRWVQPVGAAVIPPLAWFACQVTAVRRARRTDAVHALVPLAALAALAVAPAFLDVLLPGAFVVYGAAILMHAQGGADAQPQMLLAHGSMPARVWRIIGAALIASAASDVLIIVALANGRADLQPWIITVFSVGNLLLIGLVSLSPYLRTSDPERSDPQADPVERAEPDAELWQRVCACMATDKPYLDPDLTLARLARKLRVPAKALSVTINRATGQNVSRFVNDARIAAAQDALRQGNSVTEAMLSAGFNTKSNFNREFLRVAGMSPSDWMASRTTGGNRA
ncbi:MAG: AraC family transcriptional regulator [Rhodobacteraceae bacterium]|jgi:AraC-like DNA-binding protein|nr:AraC family transcriptional regulator [Paracoccaceae bacterium]